LVGSSFQLSSLSLAIFAAGRSFFGARSGTSKSPGKLCESTPSFASAALARHLWRGQGSGFIYDLESMSRSAM